MLTNPKPPSEHFRPMGKLQGILIKGEARKLPKGDFSRKESCYFHVRNTVNSVLKQSVKKAGRPNAPQNKRKNSGCYWNYWRRMQKILVGTWIPDMVSEGWNVNYVIRVISFKIRLPALTLKFGCFWMNDNILSHASPPSPGSLTCPISEALARNERVYVPGDRVENRTR